MKRSISIGLLAFTIIGCDFTPQINKKILVAQQHLSAQEYEKAIRQYNHILTLGISPQVKMKIYYQLGEIYSINLRNYPKAIENYREVIKSASSPIWLIKAEEKIGEIYLEFTQDYKNAVKIYSKLSQVEPKLKRSDYYDFQLAHAYTMNGDSKEAQKIYQKIQENIDHKYYKQSFFELGIIFFHQKEWSKAIAYWKEYMKREDRRDKLVETKFLMANAYETMEKLKLAYNLYYSILGEYPNTKVVEARLSSIYARRIARKR